MGLHMTKLASYAIFTGLGAGNIGDEMMFHGFARELPADICLRVFLHENSARQRQPYPPRFELSPISLPPATFEFDQAPPLPGLLVGTTLITDVEGAGWPLGFLAPRLAHFAGRGLPVDATGIGADFLVTAEGRQLFYDHFRSIRSWTVRNEVSRDALLDAGVDPSAVAVGADWAWLYTPPVDYNAWAESYLAGLGLRIGERLLIVNLFWQNQGESLPIWADLAAVLDRLHYFGGFQIAFFANECRHPGFDRTAAERVSALMSAPATLIPNLYFSPGEAIAILRHATVALGQRYHFAVEGVFAETIPVMLGRSPKIAGLAAELGLRTVGSLDRLDRDELEFAVASAVLDRPSTVARLRSIRQELAARALRNLDFVRRFYQ